MWDERKFDQFDLNKTELRRKKYPGNFIYNQQFDNLDEHNTLPGAHLKNIKFDREHKERSLRLLNDMITTKRHHKSTSDRME